VGAKTPYALQDIFYVYTEKTPKSDFFKGKEQIKKQALKEGSTCSFDQNSSR